MGYETGYIRHYKRNDKKNNRIIKTVEVRGLKSNSIFQDKQEVIIISKDDFDNMNNELNQLQEINKELTRELNHKDNINLMEFKKTNNKLLELMEIVNNRNQLLLNGNDKLNLMIDSIINEVETQTLNLINGYNTEIKSQLEININHIINNVKASQILEVNKILNEMSILELIRNRKKFNIDIVDSDNDININNIIVDPEFNKIDSMTIKETAKNMINFNEYYINFDDDL